MVGWDWDWDLTKVSVGSKSVLGRGMIGLVYFVEPFAPSLAVCFARGPVFANRCCVCQRLGAFLISISLSSFRCSRRASWFSPVDSQDSRNGSSRSGQDHPLHPSQQKSAATARTTITLSNSAPKPESNQTKKTIQTSTQNQRTTTSRKARRTHRLKPHSRSPSCSTPAIAKTASMHFGTPTIATNFTRVSRNLLTSACLLSDVENSGRAVRWR